MVDLAYLINIITELSSDYEMQSSLFVNYVFSYDKVEVVQTICSSIAGLAGLEKSYTVRAPLVSLILLSLIYDEL